VSQRVIARSKRRTLSKLPTNCLSALSGQPARLNVEE
jgi:hypothetical protein